jgi:hypothetical protein
MKYSKMSRWKKKAKNSKAAKEEEIEEQRERECQRKESTKRKRGVSARSWFPSQVFRCLTKALQGRRGKFEAAECRTCSRSYPSCI